MELDFTLTKQCSKYIDKDYYERLVIDFPFKYCVDAKSLSDLIEWCDTNIGEHQIWAGRNGFSHKKYIRQHKIFMVQSTYLTWADTIIVHIKDEQDYSLFLLRWS